MATTLVSPKSHNVPHLIGKNYEIGLKQSIDALLNSPHRYNSSNLGNFAHDFQDFVQSKVDPPLESIWIYAALTSSCSRAPKAVPLDRISAIKDLFQQIVSFSASCSSIKSIALAAPVVFYLYGFALDAKGFQLGAKKERKLKREIKALIDSILGYINVCYNGFNGNYDDLEGSILPTGDLISFWMSDSGVRNKTEELLMAFFPLLTADIVSRVVEGCGMIDLAAFVIAEVFLLKLCWKIHEEGFGETAQTELRAWVVGSVTGFKSPHFFVVLASMLLEPTFTTASLLSPEQKDGLRVVLFDALILVEYSFLSFQSLGQLPEKLAKCIIFTKLFATHQAIELFRERGDHTKAILYSNAFGSSTLPGLIIKLVKRDIGVEFSTNETGSSPRAFIKWILNIENKGIKVFDDVMSKFKAEFNSMEELKQLASGGVRQGFNSDFFYIDNKGEYDSDGDDDDDNDKEEKTNASMSSAFMSAARLMQSPAGKGRKRKTKDDKKSKKIKFVKYGAVDHSSSELRTRGHHSNSGSDMDDPSPDEDEVE